MFKMIWMKKAAADDLGINDQFAMMAEVFECVAADKAFPSKVHAETMLARVQKRFDETGGILS